MNPFRHLLRARGAKPPIGTWITSASPLVAEAIGHAGFDWGVIDMEHAPADLMEVVHLLQAVGNTKMVPVVRVPWNEPVAVKRVLDAGAETVLFPMVGSADEARQAVAATRYPPEGVRGMAGTSRASRYGSDADYLRHANRRVGVIVQIETAAALAELEAIAAVPGVDALFVGPADLSASMGHLGRLTHPEVIAAMADAARRARALGVAIGTLGGTAEAATRYRAAGFDYIAVGTDLGLLMHGATAAVQALRRHEGAEGPEALVHTLGEGTKTDAG